MSKVTVWITKEDNDIEQVLVFDRALSDAEVRAAAEEQRQKIGDLPTMVVKNESGNGKSWFITYSRYRAHDVVDADGFIEFDHQYRVSYEVHVRDVQKFEVVS